MTTQQIKNYSTWALRGDSEANWYESYANRSIFELGDAASILANVQPEYPGHLDADCLANISQWVETLKSNAHELLAQSGYNEKEPLHHRLSHQKLRAWCAKINKKWPIPESRLAEIEQQLEVERKLRTDAELRADPAMSLFVKDGVHTRPSALRLGDPEEIYRHLDYLTEDQALDWMNRISGHQVEWETLWALVGFDMCRAFMDCRSVQGLTYAAEGEHEHRKVFGLGICQIMNAVRGEGTPLHLKGPAIHVDMDGCQEIVPQRSWWINNAQDFDVLFRPSDIEKMGQIVNERGGWSSVEPIQADEQTQEYSGSDLVQRLGKLQISINNFHDQISYCVRFEDGQFLAELGSDFAPIAATVPATSAEQMEGVSGESRDNGANQADQNEIARLRDLVAEQSALLENLQKGNGPKVDEKTTEITFPYATKELEAMKAVAIEKWAALDPNHRQPKQAAVQEEIRKKLGISLLKDGTMPNKAIYLATAIRPDGAPRA